MDPGYFPTFRRFFRFAWGFLCAHLLLLRQLLRPLRRFFFHRWALITYLVIAALACLAVYIDVWTGRRAWAAEQERLAASGDTLEIKHLLPPRPPDAENFFAIPELMDLGKPASDPVADGSPLELWLGRRFYVRTEKSGRFLRDFRERADYWGDFRTDPLANLCAHFRKTGMLPKENLDPDPAKELLVSAQQKWQPLLDSLYAATRRPYALIVPTLQERRLAGELIWRSSKTGALWNVSRALTVHARAAVASGDAMLAENDLRVLNCIENGLLQHGTHSGLYDAGEVRRGQLEVLRQGLQKHLWTATQLEGFAAASDPAAVCPLMRIIPAVERAWSCHLEMEASRHGIESWTNKPHEKSLTEKASDFYLRHFPEGSALRACAETSKDYSRLLADLPATTPLGGWPASLRKLYDIRGVTTLLVGAMLRSWDSRRFMGIACALERHYLAHGHYPESLAALTPPLPAELLPDTDEQPLRYTTAAGGGTFRLWSVGLDGHTDDGKRRGDDVVVTTE